MPSTISNFVLLDERNGAVNRFDFYFADVVLRRADGTLYPLWTGGQASSLTASTAGPGSATGVGVDGGLPAGADSSVPSTHFYVDDHLGSMQMELASGGWPLWQGQFTPFGEEIVNHQATNAWLGPQNADGTTMHYKFTGKERDAESGLDYFGARYYASMTGRFMSPDPGKINQKHLLNPQKWNMYNYVLNNPLSLVDPDGLEEMWVQYRAFIPQASVGPIRGDNRSFSSKVDASSRVSMTMHIETDPAKNGGNPLLGYSYSVDSTHNKLTGSTTAPIITQAPTATGKQDPTTGQVTLNLQMNVQSGDAKFTKASIRSDVNVQVNEAGTQASVQGTTSGSPAFEINFAPQGGPTTNLPLQNASSNSFNFIWQLPNDNHIQKSTEIRQSEQH